MLRGWPRPGHGHTGYIICHPSVLTATSSATVTLRAELQFRRNFASHTSSIPSQLNSGSTGIGSSSVYAQ